MIQGNENDTTTTQLGFKLITMKTHFLIFLMFFSMHSFGQVALHMGAGVPNGVEVGADIALRKYIHVGGSYGYLHYGENFNGKLKLGGIFYGYLGLNRLGTNRRGVVALENAFNSAVDTQISAYDVELQQVYDDIQFTSDDFRIVDRSVSAGIGLRSRFLFLELGLRTTQANRIVHSKVDLAFDKFESAISSQVSGNEYYEAMDELQSIRADVKSQYDEVTSTLPAGLRYLPELRLGIRIPMNYRK